MDESPTQSGVPPEHPARDWLALDDAALLAGCEVHTYRASGPGGQHRNKTYSAIRLHHKPTGISAQGEESRSQHENKHHALQRLRMQIALHVRRPVDPQGEPAELVAGCIHGRGGPSARLNVGRKDARFWAVTQIVLDALVAFEGRLADAAGYLGVTSSNLVAHFRKDRHLFAAVQQIRKQFGHSPLK